ANAQRTPNQPALCTLDEQMTFKEVREKSLGIASALHRVGIQRGSRVALMGQNSFDFVLAYFGILRAGGLVVPINHKLTVPEVEYILKDSQATLFIFDGSLAPLAERLGRDIPKWAMDSPAQGFPSLSPAEAEAFSPLALDKEDLAQILYTSGTTGAPKGCLHTHGSVISAGKTGASIAELSSRDTMLMAMPIWHSSPLNNWFMGIVQAGGCLAMIREYHPLEFLTIIEKRRCTAFFGAPISSLMPLTTVPHFDDFDLSSMEAWIYGGGPIAPETVNRLTTAYKSLRFFQVYGMTEAGPTGLTLRPEDHQDHAGSIGKSPLPGAQMKLMKNLEDEAGPGETGEIWLRADSMMKGYVNNPQATEEAFHRGWYKTGDMARMDKDGYLYIVDRIKDMIITGGENVYSKEVEDRLMEHPDTEQAAVIGTPHKDWGETVTAVIVPRQGTQPTAQDFQDFLKDRLSRYKIPKIFHFAAELPHTPSGKVMKYQLRHQFNEKGAAHA
ncbi:MAG: AMP-binding protein, partial [Desulfovibrionales bacterium]|nr:AMP-binding protein [Desulfovibrionales bacterium]